MVSRSLAMLCYVLSISRDILVAMWNKLCAKIPLQGGLFLTVLTNIRQVGNIHGFLSIYDSGQYTSRE